MTPLERPRALGDRKVLTDAEVAQLKERAERLFNNRESDFIPGDNLFLALWADADAVHNPNATGSVLNMVPREFDNRTSLITDPPDGRLPPVTPEGRRRQSEGLASNLTTPWQFGAAPSAAAQPPRRSPNGPEDLSNALRCISWGVPKIAGNINYTSHQEIVQGPGYVVLLSEVNHEARIIPLDDRPHLAESLRQLNGDSRGHWEGNTLVVETTNFSPKSFFMGSADRLHLVERFTRTGPRTMDYELTVSDPTTWTKPWTALDSTEVDRRSPDRVRLPRGESPRRARHSRRRSRRGEVVRGIRSLKMPTSTITSTPKDSRCRRVDSTRDTPETSGR